MKENKKQYVLYFDLLNIVACLCVLGMHCNGEVHSFSNTRLWKESLVIETLAYWAVPIFFMLSGATLLNYREKYSTKIYFRKRLIKTLVPFIVWNLICLLEKIIRGSIDINALNPINLADMLINSRIEGVYWFFIPLFVVYLSIPVLSILKDNRTILKYMLALGLLTYSVLPFVFSIVNIPWNGNLSFPLTGGYIIFVILGYLLSTTKIERVYRYGIYSLGIVGIAVRYSMTYFLSIKQNELNKVSWGYLNWPSVLLAVAVFTLFQYTDWNHIVKSERTKKIIRQISAASFGIYLIHMPLIRALLSIFGWSTSGWKWRYCGPVIVYVCALFIISIMKKIPIIKNIVP